MMVQPERKHPRLKGYDYGQCGCYHIILCTKDKRPILSQILPAKSEADRAEVRLYRCGCVTEVYIKNIPQVYSGVRLDKYAIMPNHVHLLISLDTGATTSIPTIVRSLKRMTNKVIGASIWQASFYDTIVRNDIMYQCEWQYIDHNPDRWMEDELYVSGCNDGGLRASRPT